MGYQMKITPSSGNVFRDLGFSCEEAEHLRVRAVMGDVASSVS